MLPKNALSSIKNNYQSFNWWRNRVFVPYVIGTLTRLYPRYPGYSEATYVTEEDWDNLFVLDACRADAFERVADLSQFDDYSRVVSAGSHSSEWTRRNFTGRQFGDIVYVSANPHTGKLAGDSFHDLVPMWEQDFDQEAWTVPPEAMADAARETAKKYPNKRLIVHFMQPHGPFLGSDVPDEEIEDRFWEAYDQNLQFVLETVEGLLTDLNGRTVITADHGEIPPGPIKNALGVSNHRPRLRHPDLVDVPWAIVSGERRKIVNGDIKKSNTTKVDERLRDLGYKT